MNSLFKLGEAARPLPGAARVRGARTRRRLGSLPVKPRVRLAPAHIGNATLVSLGDARLGDGLQVTQAVAHAHEPYVVVFL